MASMGFSRDTVRILMGLVYDNLENLDEKTYIEICNAMKFIHTNARESPQELAIRQLNSQLQGLRLRLASNGRLNLKDKYISLLKMYANHSIDVPSAYRRNPEVILGCQMTVAGMENHLIGRGIVTKRDLTRMYQETKMARVNREKDGLFTQITELTEKIHNLQRVMESSSGYDDVVIVD